MRLLIVMEPNRLPLEDCEMAGPMIALYGRRPRANRRLSRWTNLSGAVWLAVLGWVLVGLVFVW